MKELKPDIDVLIRLAEAFSDNSSLKKTHVYFASRINWGSSDRYLKWMVSKNYVDYKFDGKEEKYQLTERGREMFNIILKLKEHLVSFNQIPSRNLSLS